MKYPKTALVCNRKTRTQAQGASDAEAEFDSPETIEAIRRTLAAHGVDIIALEADETLPEALKANGIEFVFNIAEGKGGRGREAQVPALLELLGIPCMGSDASAMAVSLDKNMCKRLVASYGVPTARGAVLRPADRDWTAQTAGLQYPLILKPNAEGSGKGIFENCVVQTQGELESRLREIFALLPCEMLAEEYLCGREFTVGLLGNGDAVRVFPPMEICYKQTVFPVYSYETKKHYQQYVTYQCPAALDPETERRLTELARDAFHALGCSDLARVDFRMNGAGVPCFLEVNPLPSLAPGYSDYPMTAAAAGFSYDDLLFAIYQTALARVQRTEA